MLPSLDQQTAYLGIKHVLQKGAWVGHADRDRLKYSVGSDCLVAVVAGNKYAIAVDVDSAESYNLFYGLCARGEWLDMHLYRVPRTVLVPCPDENWLPVNEYTALMQECRARTAQIRSG